MSEDRTGGPAFPVRRVVQDGDVRYDDVILGMTLRDWFAGMAMQGYIAHGTPSDVSFRDVAEKSYLMADAMIERREL